MKEIYRQPLCEAKTNLAVTAKDKASAPVEPEDTHPSTNFVQRHKDQLCDWLTTTKPNRALDLAKSDQHRQTKKINNCLRLLYKGPLAIYLIRLLNTLLSWSERPHTGKAHIDFAQHNTQDLHLVPVVNNSAHIAISDLHESDAPLLRAVTISCFLVMCIYKMTGSEPCTSLLPADQ